MRTWAVLLYLAHVSLLQGADAKRFDPSMVDPLSRRSPLDKNFMRFGRSSPSFTEESETDISNDSSFDSETNKEDNFLRSMRGKDNFIRFGRAKNDNFMRFGRGKQDNFIRFGRDLDENFNRIERGKQDNLMRFGRGKVDNYMRFGRGKQDSYMRFGRGKQDNFMRFGRGKQDNFMRFGKSKQDNYMRFGRGKQDNFMRFGRDSSILTNALPDAFEEDSDRLRRSSKQQSFIRFGKSVDEDPNGYIPIVMRAEPSRSNGNFLRFGKSKQDNFMRFGKSGNEESPFQLQGESNESKEKKEGKSDNQILSTDAFSRERKSTKDFNLIRYGRHPPSKDDGFMRFGRSSQYQLEEGTQESGTIPQRLKRSITKYYDPPDYSYPSKLQDSVYDQVILHLSSLPDDLEENFVSPEQQEEYSTRRKRSVNFKPSPPSPITEEDSTVDYISAKLRFDSSAKPEYQSSLLSAGLPNVIVGPEFSLLPDLDPPSVMLKRGRPGDQNFIRLG